MKGKNELHMVPATDLATQPVIKLKRLLFQWD